MKRGDVRKSSSVLYIGKGLIVAAIVMTASLGFLLGFFVGKKFHPLSDTRSAGISLAEGTDQPAGEVSGNEPVSERPGSDMGRIDGQMTDQQESSLFSAPGKAETAPSPKQVDTLKPARTSKATRSEQTKSASGSSEAKQKAAATKKTAPTEAAMTRKYTVQIGAFKNPEEAEALKTRMGKKGYKVFVSATKTQKREILHKVMIGLYSTRKEAEVLSIKLRNTEGLRTFVTFVLQEGTTRHR